MPNWNEILDEIKKEVKQKNESVVDKIRRKYLKQLYNHEKTKNRNIIIYYSGWLQKRGAENIEINDNDKNGFMAVIDGLDKDKGLDLILHTPGGGMAATESLIDYLRSIFGNDIRTIVPQLALSAGSLIALSSKKIIMGKQSSLGPVDPQLNGLPAQGVIDDFERAKKEMTKARNKGETGTIDAWQAILSNYSPSLIDHCYKSIKWSEKMLKNNLKTGMFDGEDDFSKKFDKIKELFSETENSKTHNRHYSMKKLKDNTDLKIEAMEEDDDYQDKILSVHHAAMHTLGNTTTVKIIENHEGRAFMSHIRNKKN